jgi:hypothetical protein
MSPLEQKCLKVAIQQIKDARTTERANYIYTAWKVFNTNQEFLTAIENKKIEFKKKTHERNTTIQESH